MNRDTIIRFVGFLLLVALIVAGRLLPHPANFTPVAAVALFAGFLFTRRTVALCIPLAAMWVSDAVIGTYDYKVMLVVYGALLFPVALRPFLRARLTPVRVGVGAVSCSVFFFVTTNLAVWLFGGWYPHTWNGLLQCYAAALPFLRNMVCCDLLWSTLLFGGYALAVAFGYSAAVGSRQVRPEVAT